jgi:hypothetical protein
VLVSPDVVLPDEEPPTPELDPVAVAAGPVAVVSDCEQAAHAETMAAAPKQDAPTRLDKRNFGMIGSFA